MGGKRCKQQRQLNAANELAELRESLAFNLITITVAEGIWVFRYGHKAIAGYWPASAKAINYLDQTVHECASSAAVLRFVRHVQAEWLKTTAALAIEE